MRELLLAHLRDPGFEPRNKSELARALEVDSKDRRDLREIIRDLEGEGLVMRLKKGRYQLREATGNVLTGTIGSQRNGNVFFHPDSAEAENKSVLRHLEMEPETRVYIPENYAQTALHGDRVAVRVFEAGIPKWWRHVKRKRDLLREMDEAGGRRQQLEGRVLKILERRNLRIVGTLFRQGKFAYVKPDDPFLPETIDIMAGVLVGNLKSRGAFTGRAELGMEGVQCSTGVRAFQQGCCFCFSSCPPFRSALPR